MFRLMLLKLISTLFCKCKKSERNILCKFAHNMLPRGEALCALLEEVGMLVKVECKVKGTVSEETRKFVEEIQKLVELQYSSNENL